jgi:hypothetical protein
MTGPSTKVYFLLKRDIEKNHNFFYKNLYMSTFKTVYPYLQSLFLQPFVLFGAGGSGKSALLSKTALQSIKVCTLKSQKLEIFAVLDF